MARIDRIEEPIYRVTIHVPAEHVGAVLKLCQERRGVQKGIQYATSERVIVKITPERQIRRKV